VDPKLLLLAALALFVIFYVGVWYATVRKGVVPPGEEGRVKFPRWIELTIGFVTNFFDTLGIGSFAPTTAAFKALRSVPDERIPGTLNVGHTLPTVTQAFIFVAIIQVDFLTLILMIAAAVVGSWLGAGVVSRWPKRNIQLGMGFALLVAATLFAMTNLNLFPGGGTALELTGVKLALGLVGNFALGALMTLGIGLYAPCMILVAMLGMNPTAAFPIMMGSCAFLMPVGSARFIRERKYSLRPALGLALGGIPAVLIAALIVKSLNVVAVRWLVVAVVLYTSFTMLRSAFVPEKPAVPVAGD
jgi:uncharacterized membrane protein YfcA